MSQELELQNLKLAGVFDEACTLCINVGTGGGSDND